MKPGKLLPVALTLLLGCGGNSFRGDVGGTTLAPKEAIFYSATPAFVKRRQDLMMNNPVLVMEMADITGLCAAYRNGGASHFLELSFQDGSITGATVDGMLRGKYAVGDPSQLAEVSAYYQGRPGLSGLGSAGSATLDSVDVEAGGSMTGSFDFTVQGNEPGDAFNGTAQISGTFHATYCDLSD